MKATQSYKPPHVRNPQVSSFISTPVNIINERFGTAKYLDLTSDYWAKASICSTDKSKDCPTWQIEETSDDETSYYIHNITNDKYLGCSDVDSNVPNKYNGKWVMATEKTQTTSDFIKWKIDSTIEDGGIYHIYNKATNLYLDRSHIAAEESDSSERIHATPKRDFHDSCYTSKCIRWKFRLA